MGSDKFGYVLIASDWFRYVWIGQDRSDILLFSIMNIFWMIFEKPTKWRLAELTEKFQ